MTDRPDPVPASVTQDDLHSWLLRMAVRRRGDKYSGERLLLHNADQYETFLKAAHYLKHHGPVSEADQ